MKTDIPLKRLTQLCPQDLLPLIGESEAMVLQVETLELPASKTSLDNVLRLQRPGGKPYLHMIEWQGWSDSVLLWRVLSYLGWLGQHRTERPILVTVVYLKPEDDVGEILDQQVEGTEGWMVRLPSVRLWEQDATIATASGSPGLMALMPLMRGATSEMVETTAQSLARIQNPSTRGELLLALGTFAEPLFSKERFIRLVTKEQLMATDLISYLLEDKITEMRTELNAAYEDTLKTLARENAALQFALTEEKAALTEEKAALTEEKAALTEEKAALEAKVHSLLQQVRAQEQQAAIKQMVADAIVVRFPYAPIVLSQKLQSITGVEALQQLHRAIIAAADVAEVERLIEEAI
jgi:hypothetical protein